MPLALNCPTAGTSPRYPRPWGPGPAVPPSGWAAWPPPVRPGLLVAGGTREGLARRTGNPRGGPPRAPATSPVQPPGGLPYRRARSPAPDVETGNTGPGGRQDSRTSPAPGVWPGGWPAARRTLMNCRTGSWAGSSARAAQRSPHPSRGAPGPLAAGLPTEHRPRHGPGEALPPVPHPTGELMPGTLITGKPPVLTAAQATRALCADADPDLMFGTGGKQQQAARRSEERRVGKE